MAAGLHKRTVQEALNASFGQGGSILVTGTSAVTCVSGVFVAIQFVEDSVFASADGLVAETQESWLDDAGNSTDVSASNGATTDGITFPAGMTIYGRWTSFKLASGKAIGYKG